MLNIFGPLEYSKPLRLLSGEVRGAVLIGLARACRELNILLPGEGDAESFAENLDPGCWYPLEYVSTFERIVESKFEDAGIVLEKAGIEFIRLAIAATEQSQAIRSGLDFLLLQCNSWGYQNFVRGIEREIGRFELINLDLVQGLAEINSSTPFHRAFERGIILGGLLALGDLCYARADNSRNPDRFEIEFKPSQTYAHSCLPTPIPGPDTWDGRVAPSRESIDCLYWHYQGLLEEQRRERAFWQAIHRSLARLVVDLREVSRQMKDLAHHDALTALPNRRGILLTLAQEHSRAVRYEQSLSVAILDLDWFKQVNDVHGHLVGDEVLRRSAAVLSGLLRMSDAMGRLGGEEFLVLLPATTACEAARAAEKLRHALAQVEFSGKHGPFYVTASFGIAERTSDIENPMEMLRRADIALYKAKAAGRNRVERYAP